MVRPRTILREVHVAGTEYVSSQLYLLDPTTTIGFLRLVSDENNSDSSYLLEIPVIGALAAGWMIKEDNGGKKLTLERLTHPGKGDPRTISKDEIAKDRGDLGANYIRARLIAGSKINREY